jgi:hypothetical protein
VPPVQGGLHPCAGRGLPALPARFKQEEPGLGMGSRQGWRHLCIPRRPLWLMR